MINTPVITIATSNGTIQESPVIKLSPFTGAGKLASTSYKVISGSTTLLDITTYEYTNNFRVPLGILSPDMTYTIKAKYNSATESSPEASATYVTEPASKWSYVEKPTISVVDVVGQPAVATTSPFSVIGMPSSHIATTWQVVRKNGYRVIYYEPESTSNLTSLSIPRNTIVDGETYIIKAKHIASGTTVRSDYAETEITIANTVGVPLAPTINITGELNNVPNSPVITTSAFAMSFGVDTHISTDYEIYRL